MAIRGVAYGSRDHPRQLVMAVAWRIRPWPKYIVTAMAAWLAYVMLLMSRVAFGGGSVAWYPTLL